MPDFTQIISLLREQMNATMSRSDVLRPLAWLVGIIAIATVLLVAGKAPEWLLNWTGALLIGSVVLYASAFIFCLLYDRDALRSEKYSLNKMAIEHGIYGDNLTGIVENKPGSRKLIEASESKNNSEVGA